MRHRQSCLPPGVFRTMKKKPERDRIALRACPVVAPAVDPLLQRGLQLLEVGDEAGIRFESWLAQTGERATAGFEHLGQPLILLHPVAMPS
jgi:hypothetical protein